MTVNGDRRDQPLPEAVRSRVVEFAASVLAGIPDEEIPGPLRREARFEPRHRARLAGPRIAALLESDGDFRRRVAERVREQVPEVADALAAGVRPAAADPVTVAAVAYLLRPDGWQRLVESAQRELDQAATAAGEAAATEALTELEQQLESVKATAKKDAERLRGEVRDARSDATELRRKVGEARGRARSAEEEARRVQETLDAERVASASAAAAAEAELRRLRPRLASAEAQLEAARRVVKEGRVADEARLRVLLDALVDAAQGLRRELALPSQITRPADAVEGTPPSSASGSSSSRSASLPGRAIPDDDPALLDRLLAMPQAHLVVDGYNVTKTGYGDLPLADQRTRLVSGLGALAARTGAEVTCVFDGADVELPALAAPRGVRVLFSAPGELADELILRIVWAEPAGRAVIVVSSDGEVARGARRAGARPVPSAVLLRRLGRG